MIAGQLDIYDLTKVSTLDWLKSVHALSKASGDPDRPFFYLGGPMTGIPKFNFPRFDAVAAKLREDGWNIVSPAELDSPGDHAAALASPDGAPGSGSSNGKSWSDFLMRDVVICAMPTCEGGIFLEGWEDSSGANLETFVLDRLGRKLYAYYDAPDGYSLHPLDRDAVLEDHVASIRKQIAEA